LPGEELLSTLRFELYALSIMKNIGFQVISVYWIDPKPGALQNLEWGPRIIDFKDSNTNMIVNALKKNENLRKLCSEINLYQSQVSLRGKVIIGFVLLEEYFLKENEDVCLLNISDTNTIKKMVFHILSKYIKDKTNSGQIKYLKDAILWEMSRF